MDSEKVNRFLLEGGGGGGRMCPPPPPWFFELKKSLVAIGLRKSRRTGFEPATVTFHGRLHVNLYGLALSIVWKINLRPYDTKSGQTLPSWHAIFLAATALA